MPTAPTFPGMYVEEVPSGVHPIVGVPTAIAAFIGWFPRGPMNSPEEVLSFADVERTFGGLHKDSDTSFALQQYFLNGGARAYVVRVAAPGAGAAALGRAHVDVLQADGAGAFTVRARDEGAWGNDLRVQVLVATDPARFDLVISLLGGDAGNPTVLRQETYRGLTADSTKTDDPLYLTTAVNAASELVTVGPVTGANTPSQPAASGLVSSAVVDKGALPDTNTLGVTVTIQGLPPRPITFPGKPDSVETLAAAFQSALRTAVANKPVWSQAVVRVVPDNADPTKSRLQVLPGAASGLTVTVENLGDDHTATALNLNGATTHAGAVALAGGGDGAHPGADELVGSEVGTGSGMFALENTDFTLLCLPSLGNQSASDNDPFASAGTLDAEYSKAVGNAIAYCRRKRALLLLDPPDSLPSPTALRNWLQSHSYVRDEYSALYYPRLAIADPTRNYLPRSVGPSGTIAGLMARIDAARGVWKAPAGTEAKLFGVQDLGYDLTDPENGTLNPIAVNCLRSFPAYGQVSWGARTLAGGDAASSDYKYVPVRRLANFLESSLLIGLKWAVFEPNDEPLWSQIRLNIGSFMHGLFVQGAFAGRTPKEAYLVRCDSTTTTTTDQGLGVVNVLVGFAPVRPAEFVIIRLQQLAGQTQS
ncbi:phage tail sheath family protein [Kitasatospora sp. NPDC085464]|uniref:phage tail sheath family protein n=1 Tax=Kitasatospora sp. NPDC085464 TaxID=3364063 RepID=UPI0037C7F5C7